MKRGTGENFALMAEVMEKELRFYFLLQPIKNFIEPKDFAERKSISRTRSKIRPLGSG